MANIECNKCGDLVDVEARTVTLPFVCKWCEEDFQTPDSPQFIVQFFNQGAWHRSKNPNSSSVFNSFLEAQKQADISEQKSACNLQYKVRQVVSESTQDQYDLKTVLDFEKETDAEREIETEKELVRAQFEFDTELIEDLINQLEEANKQIEIKDARIRVLEAGIKYGKRPSRDVADYGNWGPFTEGA